ncbi:MAG: hypothetical protein ABI866_00855 [Dokdonella sp.]
MHPRCAALLLILAPAVVDAAPSHCGGNEDIVFTCSLQRNGKIVSLCASKHLLNAKSGGSLAYRFGKPDAVEFEFPKESAHSPGSFRYSHYFRFQTDRTKVFFENEGFRYDIFSDYDGEEIPQSSVGIRVTAPSGKETQFGCTNSVEAHWNLIDGAVPCDEDEDPSTCNYKAQGRGDPGES